MNTRGRQKQKNIDIFNDTVEIVENLNIEGNSNTFKFTFNNILKNIHGTKKGTISVVPHDTITTSMLDSGGGRVCILNMASPKTAGGGVRRGSVAQEECLFRCTSLYQSIVQNFYPLKTDEALYTTDAVIVKDRHYVPLETPFKIDCVTIAAVNLNNTLRPDRVKAADYVDVMKNKIRLMLSLAKGCDTVVLGAWGSGVFKNDTKEITQMFYDILVTEGWRYMFNDVVFGVINDTNSVADNFRIFNDKLNLLNN